MPVPAGMPCFVVPSAPCGRSCISSRPAVVDNPLVASPFCQGAIWVPQRPSSRLVAGGFVGDLHWHPSSKIQHILGEDHAEWRRFLGETLENNWTQGIVLVLVVLDIVITAFVYLAEETKLLNPVYAERIEATATKGKRTALMILSAFFVEQLGHMVAFGWKFFRKPWFVLDTVVVSVSLLLEWREMREEAEAEKRDEPREESSTFSRRAARTIMALRLWKLGAFVFDIALAGWMTRSMQVEGIHAAQVYIAVLQRTLLSNGISLPPAPGGF